MAQQAVNRRACLVMTVVSLSGCSGVQSTLDPAGPAAAAVAWLWWGMLAFSTVVVIAVVALWLHAMRGDRKPMSDRHARRVEQRWLIGGGLLLPTGAIVLLLVFGIPVGHRMLPLPLAEPPLRIDVIGHQWWWEVRYPDTGVVLVNELHLPAGVPVDIHASSADVVHAFWVPRLGGKMDMIPGRTNILRIEADQPGYYRGQCAEFCGTLHARMVLQVQAHTPQDFAAWLEAQRSAPAAITSGSQPPSEEAAADES